MAVDGLNSGALSTAEANVREKLDGFEAKKSDNIFVRFGKAIRRLVNPEYKSLKSQLEEVLQLQKSINQRSIQTVDISKPYLSTPPIDRPPMPSPRLDKMYPNKPLPELPKAPPRQPIAPSRSSPLTYSNLHAVSGQRFAALNAKAKLLHKPEDFYQKKEITGGCRFGNIKPPKATTVNVDGKPFHANVIGDANANGDKFIAMQGLMVAGTNQDSIPTFYRMLLEHDGDRVVNLTNAQDGIKKMQDSDTGETFNVKNDLAVEYWPEEGKQVNYGGVIVETTNISEYNGYQVITLEIGQEGVYGNVAQETRKLEIFHFTGWPDHGVPTDEKLEQFNQFMNEVNAPAADGNVVVHCKAGVGRTGTFIVLNQLKEAIRNGEVTQDNLLEKTESLILAGRQARGPQFVQSQSQFELILTEGLAELGRLS